MTTQSHHDHVEKQFSSQASEYLTSTVHASGRDLQRLAVRLADYPDASVLDMGCGAGHASFVAAQNVSPRWWRMTYLPICWMSWHKLPKPGN